jgi:hypothetical protein
MEDKQDSHCYMFLDISQDKHNLIIFRINILQPGIIVVKAPAEIEVDQIDLT